MGDGYPSEVRTWIPEEVWATCGSLKADFEIESLDFESSSLDGVLNGDFLDLSVLREGDTALVLEGTVVAIEDSPCGISAGETAKVTVQIEVRSRLVRSVEIGRPFHCRDAESFYLGTSSKLDDSDFRLILLDDRGDPIVAQNVEKAAQANVRLKGNFSKARTAPETLREWVTPASAGVVQAVFDVGPSTQIEVVDDLSITEMEVEFQLGGTASGPTTLVSGQTYPEVGWGRAGNRIAPIIGAIWVEGSRLCTKPNPDWFVFQTLTPEVCEIAPHGTSHFTFYESPIGHAVRFVEDGRCQLLLEAPGIIRGVGETWTLEADFRDTEFLHDFEGR